MRTKHLWVFLALVAVTGLAGSAGPARAADLIDCTIRDIQDTSSVLWDTLVVADDTLRVTGWITAADTKATGFGYYLEDFNLSAQYRGLDIFTGGTNMYQDYGLSRGQFIRVKGKYADFSGGAELVSPSGSSFGAPPPVIDIIGAITPLPAPLTVTTGDIGERSVTGELYEGMLCKLNHSIRCTNKTALPGGTFQAVDNTLPSPLDTILVDLNTLANPGLTTPAVGSVITLCQGIVDQRGIPSASQLRGYRLQVRDGADIALPTPPSLVNIYAVSNDSIRVVFDKALDPVTAENRFNYSRLTGKAIDAAILQPEPTSGVLQVVVLACVTDPQTPAEPESVVVSGVKSSLGVIMPAPLGDAFVAGVISIASVQTPLPGHEFNGPMGTDTTQYNGKTVTVRATVTARFGTLVFLEDPAGGLRSGMKLFAPTSSMGQGDDVTVVGIPLEFFDETEFSGSFFERINGAGVMPPAISIPSTGIEALNDTVAAGGTVESYEHVLVKVNNVAVSHSSVGFGEWIVKGGGACFDDPACDDTVHCDDRGFSAYTYRPVNGDQLTSVTGPIEISFGTSKIEPRTDADFVRGPVVAVDGGALQFALRSVGANPISLARGTAQFAISLPVKGQPTLALYDLRGRLVKTLTDGSMMDAGTHSLLWNGTDTGGRFVQAGVYFAQLRLGERIAAAKLVVTR